MPIPDFNGTVRLMALAWTKDGVGHAEKDVLVRDPVVVTASLPSLPRAGRPVAPQARPCLRRRGGGKRRALRYLATVTPSPSTRPSPTATIALEAGERKEVLVPISGANVGDDVLTVALTLPDGTALEKHLNLGVRLNEPPVATTDFVELAPGGELSVTADRLAGLVPGTASIQVSASGAGRLNVPAILRALDRYPYGCTEQIASRAMPLVYLNDVAIRAGLAGDPDIRDRVEKAVAGVLANQSAAGIVRPVGAGQRRSLARCLCHRLPDPRPPEGL